MTEEDEEVMLDNFVTFFIAGESALFLLRFVKCSKTKTKSKFLNLIVFIR